MKMERGCRSENESGEEKIYSIRDSLLPASTPLRAYRARMSSEGANFAAAQKALPASLRQKRRRAMRIITNNNPVSSDMVLRSYKSNAIIISVTEYVFSPIIAIKFSTWMVLGWCLGGLSRPPPKYNGIQPMEIRCRHEIQDYGYSPV